MDHAIAHITTGNQISALANLAQGIWHEYFSGMLSDEQIDYMVERFQSRTALLDQIQNGGYAYYFIMYKDVPVGYFGVRPHQDRLFLSKIYIQKDYRGQGLASAAFRFIESLAQDLNLSSIYLTVYRHNTNSINIYLKKGFELIGEQKKSIGNGFVMDDFVFEKKIMN